MSPCHCSARTHPEPKCQRAGSEPEPNGLTPHLFNIFKVPCTMLVESPQTKIKTKKGCYPEIWQLLWPIPSNQIFRCRQQRESDSMGPDHQLISPTDHCLLLPCWELPACCVVRARLLMIKLINQINQVLCLSTFTSHCLLFGHFSACKHTYIKGSNNQPWAFDMVPYVKEHKYIFVYE